METIKWTDSLQAICACGSLIVTVLGFVFVLYQLKQVDRTIRGETNASLCQQSIEVLNAMMSKKDCYPYFYDGKELAEDSPNRVEILILTEMVVNYLDLVALQKDNLPENVWARWRNFILDTVSFSPVVKQHLKKYHNWYSDELNQIINQASSDLGKNNS